MRLQPFIHALYSSRIILFVEAFKHQWQVNLMSIYREATIHVCGMQSVFEVKGPIYMPVYWSLYLKQRLEGLEGESSQLSRHLPAAQPQTGEGWHEEEHDDDEKKRARPSQSSHGSSCGCFPGCSSADTSASTLHTINVHRYTPEVFSQVAPRTHCICSNFPF